MMMATILIVEDEAAIAEVLQDALEDEGYRVVTARNGREGLNSVEQEQPDLVLSDIMMPILDGRAMLRAMQAHPTYRSIPVIFMSAAARREVGSDLAPVAFIPKPFSIIAVLDTVAQYVGGA